MEEIDNNLFNDQTYSDIILDLKILSKLKKDEKLLIYNNKLMIDTSYLKSISRIFNRNSRDNTISYLENLDIKLNKEIENSVLTLNGSISNTNYLKEDPSKILINLNLDLNLCLVGLNNLIHTYTNDEVIKSRLEILINNIGLKTRKISELLVVKIST